MADAVVAGGLHRVETVMGIPVGVDVRDDGVDPAALDRVFAHLRAADDAFSPYRADERCAPPGRGDARAAPTRRPEVRAVLARCARLRRATGGWFDVRATGRLDPSGFVKGWAVDGAVAILRAAGARNLCVHAGGDVRVLGERAPGLRWRIGVQHPRERDRVAAVLHAPREGLAVATSGAYERGAHIVDPHTGRPPSGAAVGDRRRARARHGGRLRDGRVRDGDGRAGVDGDARALRGADDPRARPRALDPRDGRPARRVARRGRRAAAWVWGRPGDRHRDHRPTASTSSAPRCASSSRACAASRPTRLPPALLDIRVRRVRVPGGDVFLVQPADWEQLRHEEGGAGRGVPYWATPWPSGAVLAGAVAEDPPPAGRARPRARLRARAAEHRRRPGGRVRPRHRRQLRRRRLRRPLARAQRARRRGRAGRLGRRRPTPSSRAARGTSCSPPTSSTCARASRPRWR